jgi:predicted phosphoadenosine phosphosulfate sulfurtransferase
MEGADKQHNNSKSWLAPYMFKPGQSGNPAGRPKTKTLKEYARDMLASMTEEERQDYLKGIDKKTIWEMAEGKAPQTVDSNVKVTLPKPLLDNVYSNNRNEETDKTKEED